MQLDDSSIVSFARETAFSSPILHVSHMRESRRNVRMVEHENENDEVVICPDFSASKQSRGARSHLLCPLDEPLVNNIKFDGRSR